MSMEIYLLSSEVVPSTTVWQSAINTLGFDVHFLDERSLLTHTIQLRAQYKGKAVLIELEQASLAKIHKLFPDAALPDSLTHVHTLYWNKTLEGGVAAYQAAAAYAGLAKGLMIDSEEGKLNTPTRAIEIARDMAAKMPMLEAAMAEILAKMTRKSRN